MTKVDLHELVKLPHGKAKAALVRAGLWDEDAGKDERDWLVEYNVTYSYDDSQVVSARTSEEAFKKVESQKDISDEYTLIKVEEL